MKYVSETVHIGEEAYEKFFWEKYENNIFYVFRRELHWQSIKNKKYQNLSIGFHINEEKYSVFFSKDIYFKKGRTIFSCMKDLVQLLKEWNVNNRGHFCVVVD